MKSFRELQEETRDTHLDFLLTDLSAASTFLDVARTTQNVETRSRNVQNATRAHDAVLRFLPRVPMSEQQNSAMRERLDLLLARIEAFTGPQKTIEEQALTGSDVGDHRA